MKLSIIVPVYNVEKFLPRCLDSLIRQDLSADEYEVICVNDGSTDNSALILKEYQQRYPDIFQIITQENQGLGGARNTGTAQAQGEYVAYLDSDDYVVNKGYAHLLETIRNERKKAMENNPLSTEEWLPDIVIFHSENVVTNGIERLNAEAPQHPISIIGGDDLKKWRFNILGYTWNKLYRRAFLEEHHCRFQSVFCEDELFNYEVFLHSPHFCVTDGNIYRYEQNNPSSLLHLKKRQKLFEQMNDLEHTIGIMNGYLTTHGNEDFAMGVQQSISRLINTYHKKAYQAHLSYPEWRKQMNKLCKFPYCKMTKGGSAMGRLIVMLKNGSLKSYGLYVLVCFFYERLFERFIQSHFLTPQKTKTKNSEQNTLLYHKSYYLYKKFIISLQDHQKRHNFTHN